MIPLNLSAYEQSALAEVAALCSTIKYEWYKNQTVDEKRLDELLSIIDGFNNIKWDNLYDKLHRTGANS